MFGGGGPIFAIIINVFNNCFPTMPKLHAFCKKSTDIISTIVVPWINKVFD